MDIMLVFVILKMLAIIYMHLHLLLNMLYYNCSWQVISKKDFMLLNFVVVIKSFFN